MWVLQKALEQSQSPPDSVSMRREGVTLPDNQEFVEECLVPRVLRAPSFIHPQTAVHTFHRPPCLTWWVALLTAGFHELTWGWRCCWWCICQYMSILGQKWTAIWMGNSKLVSNEQIMAHWISLVALKSQIASYLANFNVQLSQTWNKTTWFVGLI